MLDMSLTLVLTLIIAGVLFLLGGDKSNALAEGLFQLVFHAQSALAGLRSALQTLAARATRNFRLRP
jgi:hypothetical protein